MIETKELTHLKAQVTKVENQAQLVQIETQENYTQAVDLLSKLKETGNLIKTKRESITKPLNEALRNARELFKPIEDQFANAESIIKTKLLDYKRKVDDEARKKEAQIAKRVEEGTLKLETAEKKLESIERVDATTRGNIGEVQVRKVRKVRIINEAAIPRQYLVPDMVAIRRDALNGIQIEGTEVYEEEIIAAGSI